MRMPIGRAAAIAALSFLLSLSASAHVTLETQRAAAGSTYKAVLRVGHGCGSSPTTAIRVRIPDGMIAVKPMPKPGWSLATKVEPYAQPVKYYETTLTEGVTEIAWTGGSLPDAWYDEFVFRGRLPDAAVGTKVWFPVVQECADGVTRWIEIPAAGRTADDYEHPAAMLEIVAEP
ncbi:MAG TPA: YcnI family protein [Geminicoccaceae bacterium]|nr:YcnI family protein [Geminicoccus sp.]HMU52424.1 YcnI family protein [Geminicoccaceae bacterium]